MPSIAYFVTPHGLGHAARAAAVMQALQASSPAVSFDLFTTVDEEFFVESGVRSFTRHAVETDVGVAQDHPLHVDVDGTIRRLDAFYPLRRELVERMAGVLRDRRCRLAVCDIAPLGLAAARRAGIPSVLTENFTWDWIYRGFAAGRSDVLRHANRMARLFRMADHRIQTEPVCRVHAASLTVPPVCRPLREPRERVRRRLGVGPRDRLVLITMGGNADRFEFVHRLGDVAPIRFLIPAAGVADMGRLPRNVLTTPPRGMYHPDLVCASDVVVAKLGYGTVAEVVQAGVPMAYVTRPDFREAVTLAEYVESKVPCLALSGREFRGGDWIRRLADLPRDGRSPGPADGAACIARFLSTLLGRTGSIGAVRS